MTDEINARDFYKFKNAVMAEFVIDEFLNKRDRFQWDNALKPIYRHLAGGVINNSDVHEYVLERVNYFTFWLDRQWNALTLRTQIVKYPPNIRKFWNVCFLATGTREDRRINDEYGKYKKIKELVEEVCEKFEVERELASLPDVETPGTIAKTKELAEKLCKEICEGLKQLGYSLDDEAEPAEGVTP